MWNIVKKPIAANFVKADDTIRYIVLHDTGNASPSADAAAHQRYFNDKAAQASYHYICDETTILECVGPGNAAYHTGVGKSGLRQDGKISLITNYNSVGIAYCICKGKDTKKAVENAAIAAAYACRQYGLTPKDIVRHYDVTDKLCPYTMLHNEIGLAQGENLPRWADFEAFRALVAEILESVHQSEELADFLYDHDMITDKDYWTAALSGLGELNVKWLRILLSRGKALLEQ